jgi:MarR-like DNA-binding transcriptional regulator SgrR of sgrS sRNA
LGLIWSWVQVCSSCKKRKKGDDVCLSANCQKFQLLFLITKGQSSNRKEGEEEEEEEEEICSSRGKGRRRRRRRRSRDFLSLKYQSHNGLCETKKFTQSCNHPAHHPKLQSFTRQKWNGQEGESQEKKQRVLETNICCRIVAPPSQEKNLHKSF